MEDGWVPQCVLDGGDAEEGGGKELKVVAVPVALEARGELPWEATILS